MSGRYSVLVVSGDRVELRRSCRFLQACGYDVRSCADWHWGATWLTQAPPTMLLVGKVEPSAAAQLLQAARKQTHRPFIPCLRSGENLTPAEALDWIQAGWDDLLLAPVAQGELLARLRAAARLLEFEKRWSAQRQLDFTDTLVDRESWIQRLDARRSTALRSPEPTGFVALLGLDPVPGLGNAAELPTFPADSREFQTGQELLLRSAVPGEVPGRWDRTTLAFYLPRHQESEAVAWGEARLAELQEDDRPALVLSCALCPVFAAGDLQDYLGQAEDALQLARDSGGDIVITSKDVDEECSSAPPEVDAQLFTDTTAEEIMSPCPVLLSADDTPQQALRLLKQMQLSAAVVVDRQGHYLGSVTVDSLQESLSGVPRARQSGSLRLLRQVVTHPPHFPRETSLADLLAFFAERGDSATYAIVTHQRRPLGWIDRQFLAEVNQAPLPEELAPLGMPHAGSRFLLVAQG